MYSEGTGRHVFTGSNRSSIGVLKWVPVLFLLGHDCSYDVVGRVTLFQLGDRLGFGTFDIALYVFGAVATTHVGGGGVEQVDLSKLMGGWRG